MVFVFFFQAEDGIRDVAVTGVQTCALPISRSGSPIPGISTAAAWLRLGNGSGPIQPEAQAMEIILREDVQYLGKVGEVVKVKDGYARNYLLPKGLAYPATEANKKKIAYEGERVAKQRAAEKTAAESEATRLAEVQLTFDVKVGEEEKLYGSVTASDIQRKLEELGIHVDKRKIDLAEPIRELGEYNVGIKIHPEVRPEVRVTVVKE